MASTEAVVAVPFFKKKRARPTTARQLVLPSHKARANLLSAGTKRTSSQRHIDDPDEDETDEGKREGPGINWTSTGGHVNKILEILAGDEAEELLAKRARKDDADEEEVPDDGLYHGQKSFKSLIKKSQEVPKSMRTGPVRSNNSTIRTVTIVDYQPDVCKDYRETGFCGFGDTCKFLHDRGTYLAGWQLDKLAANPQKQAEDASASGSDDDDIPFACLIGRHPFTEPIVTRCGHYFCSSCAIKRFAKTPKCAACGAPTGGIFNRADKVIAKMKKNKAEGQLPGEGEVIDSDLTM
ncbi:hypothetical protein B0F90DRAFT_1052491 [Multifurca ochricompacta]|uniref:Pre-mRNA-splicing factor CWC24 n=1 Tax=Multifurca ochricompacta TaxID=376703 RepID=A0AAD4QP91_9AGAM|nr:hypothetical protein B0F90DRAFT_1052491 [Multifurca ochricompacta]